MQDFPEHTALNYEFAGHSPENGDDENAAARRTFLSRLIACCLLPGAFALHAHSSSQGAAGQAGDAQIRALVFDAYGTLFDVYSVSAACEEIFPGNGPAVSQMWRTKQLEYSWLSALMGRYEDFEKLTESGLIYTCKALHLNCTAADRSRLMGEYNRLTPFPEVRQALASLSRYPLAILSNGSPRMLREVVRNAGLDATFAHVMSVDQVKSFKTSPRVYEIAPQTLGVRKEAIGFVSSNCWDAIGAKSFGFRTFWINRTGAPPEELSLTPDVTIQNLAELSPLLA